MNESSHDITRNSRLSYKASEASNMKKTSEGNKSFISAPIKKLETIPVKSHVPILNYNEQ